jgi:hypothetical protein
MCLPYHIANEVPQSGIIYNKLILLIFFKRKEKKSKCERSLAQNMDKKYPFCVYQGSDVGRK